MDIFDCLSLTPLMFRLNFPSISLISFKLKEWIDEDKGRLWST